MIRAYIADDLCSFGLRVLIVQEADGAPPHSILRIHDDPARFAWEPIDLDSGREIPSTLTIGNEEARALLDSLTRHFHGAEDTRALRRDYDAERKRVDMLTERLAVIASALASQRPDWVTAQLEDVMHEAGQDFIEHHPDLFRGELI